MKTYDERIQIYFEKYAEEIQAARRRGQNYAEVNQEDQIHFCTVADGSTPMNWGWGPDCDGFWI